MRINIKYNRLLVRYFFILLFLALFIALFINASQIGDFNIYLKAAKLLRLHQNIYLIPDSLSQYLYSPLFALLLVPFSYLPTYIPNLIWMSLDILWIFRIWKLIEQRLELQFFTKKEKNLLVFLSFLMVFRFLHYDLALAQLSVFMLWSILESIALIEKNKNLTGSLLLAVAINIKLLPMVVLPYLLYKKYFKATALTSLFLMIFLYLPVLFIPIAIGMDYNNYLLGQWWSIINPFQNRNMVETNNLLHSLTALIPTLLMKTEGENAMKRNIVDLAPGVVYFITDAIRVGLILFTFYFTGFKNRKQNNLQRLWEISYITLLIPLIFPHQQKYAFFLLLPAFTYLVYFLMLAFKNKYANIGKNKWTTMLCLLSVSFILMTLTTDAIIGRYYCDVTQHFKTITYGALIVIIVLSLAHPKYLNPVKL